jgi:ABC-type nickel/cobalt efflux system permease component RcnA
MNAQDTQINPLEGIGPRSMGYWKDRLGIFASVACAIHCAATPVLLGTLPALKFTEWMASPLFHQIAAAVCCGIVALAIWPAFVRFRDYRILSLSSIGLGLILSAAFFLPDNCCSQDLKEVQAVALHSESQHSDASCSEHGHEHEHIHDHGHGHESSPAASMQLAGIGAFQPWMTPLGGVLLIAAHGLNLGRRRKCESSACTGECS